ncbi:MAG TPA: TIGR00645 family protein [Stellaceae bacterium]|nr:TIGR00645 family protein [Stellaceae bacterium]
MERLTERTLIAARWLLAPLYLGLALLLSLFVVQFFQDLWHAARGVIEAGHTQLIIEALGMVDLALVASLIVMVMLSSYENYLSRLDIANVSAQLGWLAKLDAGSVKVKVMVAIVVISAIDLLQAFLDIEDVAEDKLLWRVIVLLTFVTSALALAWLDRLTAKLHRGD